MKNQDKEEFSYTYSAKEQEEANQIRKKYVATEDKMEKLRKLDASVTKKATIVSITVGFIGALIICIGICYIIIWHRLWFILSVIIGIAILAVAYPAYQKVIKKEREKIAPEIIRLTDELLK